MNSKPRNSSAQNKQETQKVVSEAISSIKGQKLSNDEIIKKIASDKRTSLKPPKIKPQPKLPIQVQIQTTQEPIINKELRETKQDNINLKDHLQEIETLNQQFQLQERNYQMKARDKTRELNQMKEKNQQQEMSIDDLNLQLKQIKALLEQKIGSDQVSYQEKRNILMTQTLLNQRRLIDQYTKAMQQTKIIQVELDYQFDRISQYLTNQTLDKTMDNFLNEVLKMRQKLNYVTSQEKYNKGDDYFKKSKSKKDNLELSLRIENCLAQVTEYLSQNNEIQFGRTQLYETLTTLSIQLLQSDKIPLKIDLQNPQTILDNHLIRVQGKFNSLFPYYNSTKELVIKNIQNDKVFQALGQQDIQLEELQTITLNKMSLTPTASMFLFKSISLLKSILVHTLACIHTFNLQPHFKLLQTKILPFNEDCLTIYNQYQDENPSMGAQVLWGLFKVNAESIQNDIQATKQEFITMKSQYKGLWSNVLNQEYFK